MKLSALFVGLSLILMTACTKKTSEESSPVPETENLSENIVTQISGQYRQPNNAFPVDGRIMHNYRPYSFSGPTFLTDSLTTSRYFTELKMDASGYNLQTRILPLTPAAMNYVRGRTMTYAFWGASPNSGFGTIPFAYGTGSVVVPAGAAYGSGQSTPLWGVYMEPTNLDFIVSSPLYPAYFLGDKKSYLNSVGVIALFPSTDGKITPLIRATMTVNMPIPANLSMVAPDSIDVWELSPQMHWKKATVAYKRGNQYQASVGSFTWYNFAVPSTGTFKTVRLRTTSGAPVINTTVQLKNGQTVIAEAQTDWDGNAVVFAPVRPGLNCEIHYTAISGLPSTVLYSTPVNVSAGSESIDVTVPDDTRFIVRFKGRATRCDGTPIQKGKLFFTDYQKDAQFIVPVIDGEFNRAIAGNDLSGYDAYVVDYATGQRGGVQVVSPNNEATMLFDATTCAVQSQLYLKYTIDGGPENIVKADWNDVNAPVLTTTHRQGRTVVIAKQQNTGFHFITRVVMNNFERVFHNAPIEYIWINNQEYAPDLSKPNKLSFYNGNFGSAGVYMGELDFYAKDPSGVSKHIKAYYRTRFVW